MQTRCNTNRWTTWLLVVVGTAVVGIVGRLTPALVGGASPSEEFSDVRRVVLRPEQVAGELEKVQQGGLRSLPMREFEDLLLRATKGQAPRESPRLLATHYRARLVGDDLIGSATWTIRNPGPGSSLLAVDPLQIAIRRARWADDRPAMIADFDPRPAAPGPELFVDRPGDQSLTMEWSARGIAEAGGTHFDWRVPACAISILELDLPAKREPVIPRESALLIGPLPGSAAGRQLWRLTFANADHLDIRIPSANGNGSLVPVVLSRQQNRQEINLSETTCEFAFNLEIVRGGVRELAIECDPKFQPTEVVVRNLESWDFHSGSPSRVTVHVREAMTGGTLILRGLAPIPPDRPWISPAAKVVGSIMRGETLTIQAPSDIQLADLRPGTFRIVDAVAAPERGQSLTLQSSMLGADGGRPTARIRPVAAAFRVIERLWWRADTAPQALIAELTTEVVSGAVGRNVFEIPFGWDVERVESALPEMVSSWSADSLRASGSASKLNVEWARPLVAGQSATLVIRLVNRKPTIPSEVGAFQCPELLPVGAAERSGFLAVRAPPGWTIATEASRAPAKKPADRIGIPWNDLDPDVVLALPVSSPNIRFERRSSTFRTAGKCQVVLSANAVRVVHRLTIEPQAHPFDEVLLGSATDVDYSQWVVVGGSASIREIQSVDIDHGRLAAAVTSPIVWSAATACIPMDRWHRVRFTAPVMEPVVLELTCDRPLDAGEVPIFRVAGAPSTVWEMTVDRRAAPEWDCAPVGTQAVSRDADGVRRFAIRVNGASQGLAIKRMTEWGSPSIGKARLTIDATQPARVGHLLTFEVSRWSERSFPIEIPGAASAVRIRIDGQLVPLIGRVHAAGGRLRFEIRPPANDLWRMEIQYVLAIPLSRHFDRLVVQPPKLPIETAPATELVLPAAWQPAPSHDWVEYVESATPILASDDEFNRTRHWIAADSGNDGGIWVVRHASLTWLSAAMSVIGLLVGLSGPARIVAKLAIVASALLLAGAIWLPAPLPPLLLGPLAVSLVLIVRTRIARLAEIWWRATDRTSPARAAATAGMMGLLCLGGAGPAAASLPTIVYVVLDAAGGMEGATILAPPQFLDRLRKATAAVVTGVASERAVVVDARYDGTIDGATAHFKASIQVHSFQAEPGEIVLPFGGAMLLEATVDGAPAFPKPAGEGTAFILSGRGSHTIELALKAPCLIGTEREVRFAIPELASSRLTFRVPKAADYLRCALWRGAQRVTPDDRGLVLDADLGRVGAIHIRWWDAPRLSNTVIRVQEAYLWDLQEESARLFANLRYSIVGGTTSLAVDLPTDIEVIGVSARALDVGANVAPPPWLRDWRITNEGRSNRLTLEFAAPISGAWQISLECVPRGPFPATFVLPFPSVSGAVASPGVYAWRARELELSVARMQGVVRMSEELFLKEHWLPARLEPEPRLPTQAYIRTAFGGPLIRLRCTGTSR